MVGDRWEECAQCCLSLLSSSMETHAINDHRFDQLLAYSQHTPFIRRGIFVSNLCTLKDLAFKHKNKYALYMHPDALMHCKFKACQPVIVNDNIVLEVHCSKSVPIGSVAVSQLMLINIFESVPIMVTVQACDQEHWTPAWICHVSTRSLSHAGMAHIITNPHSYRGKRFICENESFIIDCFGNAVVLRVKSVVSQRNFRREEKIDTITSAMSSCSLENSKKELYLVTECTKFVIVNEGKKEILSLRRIGGMPKVKETLKLAIERYFGGSGPVFDRGCLLHGLQGSGKSALVEAMADNYRLQLLIPQSYDIFSEDFEEYLNNLTLFEDLVSKSSPCIVLFDNIENFCPIQTVSKHPNGCCFGERFNTSLHNISLMKCFVIGCTRDINSIHRSIQFFELILEVPIPSKLERLDILRGLIEHHEIHHDFSEDDIKAAADMAHGFSGYDLNRICTTIKMKSKVTKADLFELINSTGPSILKEAAIECPNVKWEDVGGQEKLKEILKWSIERPIKEPLLFKGCAMKGILLYGPPGCSKTMIVKALATECGLNFLWVQGSQLHGKYVGDSEQAIRVLFRRARSAAPCVIFFDELDAFAPKRGSGKDTGGVTDRCVSLLMTEMDGILGLKDVFIVAATNRPDHIDPALLRAGRFDIRQYVPLPDLDTRTKILKARCQKGSMDEDVDVDFLAKRMEGYSCAEVSSLYEFAGSAAFTENNNTNKIKMKHFLEAVSNLVPLTKAETLQWYEEMRFLA